MSAVQEQIDEERGKMGDNGMDEDTFRAWIREIISANAVCATANAARTRVRKQAKAAGIELGKADQKIRQMAWTPQEQREDARIDALYSKWLSMPMGHQFDLLDGIDEDEVAAIDADAMGFFAATTGKGAFGVPPDTLAPEFHQKWLAGWTRGQTYNSPSPLKPDPEPNADEEPCAICGGPDGDGPPGDVTVCPGCDAEWPFEETVDQTDIEERLADAGLTEV